MRSSVTFRTRMMLLFCSISGLLLVISYFVLYLVVARIINAEFDRRLLETAATLSEDLATYTASPDDITEVDSPGQIFEIFDELENPVAISRSLHQRPLPLHQGRRSGQFIPKTFDLPEWGRIRAVSVPVRSTPITALDHWGMLVESGPGATLVVCSFTVEP